MRHFLSRDHLPHLPGDAAPTHLLAEEEAVYAALVLGIRDYVAKNGFQGAVLGLSGGIDSALALYIAVDALGPAEVEAVLIPPDTPRP